MRTSRPAASSRSNRSSTSVRLGAGLGIEGEAVDDAHRPVPAAGSRRDGETRRPAAGSSGFAPARRRCPTARCTRRPPSCLTRARCRRGRSRGGRQIVDGHDASARSDIERWGVSGRHRRLEVARVDHLATDGDIVDRAGAQVSHLLAVSPSPQVLVLGEDADLPRPREPRGREGEVLADLLARRPLVVPRVLADLVDPVLTERQRVHPVVRRRAVQTDERIRVEPVAARGMPAVDQRHLDVGLRHQRVDEREAARAGSDDQIIGGDEHGSHARCRSVTVVFDSALVGDSR